MKRSSKKKAKTQSSPAVKTQNKYKMTATGSANRKIVSNDGETWFIPETGEVVFNYVPVSLEGAEAAIAIEKHQEKHPITAFYEDPDLLKQTLREELESLRTASQRGGDFDFSDLAARFARIATQNSALKLSLTVAPSEKADEETLLSYEDWTRTKDGQNADGTPKEQKDYAQWLESVTESSVVTIAHTRGGAEGPNSYEELAIEGAKALGYRAGPEGLRAWHILLILDSPHFRAVGTSGRIDLLCVASADYCEELGKKYPPLRRKDADNDAESTPASNKP